MTDETKETKASSESGDQQEQSSPAMQQIVDMGSSVVKNRHGTVHCLTIVGQVEGHMVLPNNTKSTKYEHVLPLLASLEESDDVDGLLLLLNTVGGDIEAGLAIAELVAGMRLPTVTLVLGGGHSIGVPLAVCGKETFIASSASMTIHPVRMSGTVIAAPETYRYFERIRERIVKFVAAHSHISEERFRQLMLASGDMANDVGTVLYGEEAVTLGIIDHVGSLSDALDSLYRQMDRRRTERKTGGDGLPPPPVYCSVRRRSIWRYRLSSASDRLPTRSMMPMVTASSPYSTLPTSLAISPEDSISWRNRSSLIWLCAATNLTIRSRMRSK